MFRILMASNYNSPNTYVKSIVDVLNDTYDVVCDVNSFWNDNLSFDIIHIQWVEELFNWQKLTKNNIEDLKKQLFLWKSKAVKIVITRHNKLPHAKDILGKQLYETAYQSADAIVHLGDYSAKTLKTSGENVIIPHVNYFDLVEFVEIKAARAYINIPKKGTLFLSFGSIRDIEEEQQIIKAFKTIKTKNDYLLICNSLLFNKKPSFFKDPISRLKYSLKSVLFKRNHIFFRRKRLLNSELKYYLNAASIVISPRINTLNSGVIFMGFSFSKVVIGPNIGNIGPVLSYLKNPNFKPNDINSIAKAMEKAKSLIGTTVEVENYKYAQTACSPLEVGCKHSQLYKSLLNG